MSDLLAERIDSLVPNLGLKEAIESPPDYRDWDIPSLQINFAKGFDKLIGVRPALEDPLKKVAKIGDLTFWLMLNNDTQNIKRMPNQKGGEPYNRSRLLRVELSHHLRRFDYEAESLHVGAEDLDYDECVPEENLRMISVGIFDKQPALTALAHTLGVTEDMVHARHGGDQWGSSGPFEAEARVESERLREVFGASIKIASCLRPEMFTVPAD